MFKKIFPLNLQLKIFQLEGYNPTRFLTWILKNFWVRKTEEKKKLILTPKIKLIRLFYFAVLVATFIFVQTITQKLLISMAITLIIATQPYIALIVSSLFFIPAEVIYNLYLIQKTRNKILSFKKLKVIAITGSYGKSSTKEILYQLLKNKYKVLKTPESYNTVLGISKVVDYELDGSYDFFICEMAAYHPRDIKKLCRMIPPQYGILTGITSQHLERFRSLKNIIRTKFELPESVEDQKKMVYNLKNIEVGKEVAARKIRNPIDYFEAKKISFTPAGTQFVLNANRRSIPVITRLFGYANVENLLGAMRMANLLNIDIKEIVKSAKNLNQTPHRFSLSKYGRATFVDNTFSSNEMSFEQMIKTAKAVSGKKVLITPGLVELGKTEQEIHKKLGQASRGVFDKIILVGKNRRTLAFSDGLQEEVKFINDLREEYFAKINEVKDEFDWVFLENDITENY